MTRKTNTHAQADEPRLYEYAWRNKWLTDEAASIDDMIGSLQEAADELRKMKARGVTLEQDGGVQDDNATLITDDPAVAEEFGFDDAEGDKANAQSDVSARQPSPGFRHQLIANLDRQEYLQITDAWPVHLAVLRGELAPPGARDALFGSWSGCTAEVVSSGKGPQSEAVTELLALQALAGNGDSGTFYGDVRRSYRNVTGSLSWAITRLPEARELCYRLLSAPADYSWLTLVEAKRLVEGVLPKAKRGFCAEFARWLAARPGLPQDTRTVLSGPTPLANLFS